MDSQTIILLCAFGLAVFAAVILVKILNALNRLIELRITSQRHLDRITSTLTNEGASIYGNLDCVARMACKTVNHLKGVDEQDYV
jgi:hypothetical protein